MNRFNQAWIFILAAICMMTYNNRTELFAATGSVNVAETNQTIEGFGGSITWYANWLTGHPNKDDIYDYLFNELGLDILRLKNDYRNNPANFVPDIAEIVQAMYYTSDFTPKIMISSWSPPSDLKSNNSTENGGTLKQENGEYVYGKFAQYWVDALDAFESVGIKADYISIQNEPSFIATWESCVLADTETPLAAGYDHALDSVYYAFQQLQSPPKILASEVHGIGYNLFQSYARRFNHDEAYGYAYHLYHGGDGNNNPDAFNANLSAIANSYSDKPIFQTEYDYGGWFNTAWLMHNCLVNGNVSGYLYWALIWPTGGNGLVELENPFNTGSWTTDDGFIVTKTYWAFRQFSKFIFADWKRVFSDVDDGDIRMSAYISPENDMLTLVILNVGQDSKNLGFDIQNFDITSGEIIRTSETEDGEFIGSFDGSSSLEIPGRSITTLSFSGEMTEVAEENPLAPDRFVLGQNYPNPFNATTAIDFSILESNNVQLKIYDISGREKKTLVNKRMSAGEHTVRFNADDLSSGVYFYRIKAGDLSQMQKMILIK
jgi:glucuronoarabinoxylan endo-1,4-beta-xylanase